MLWLILESDIKNRNGIIEFLKSIPENLVISIKKVLEDNPGFSKDIDEEPYFEQSVTTEYGTIFSYIIEYFFDEKNLIIKHEFSTPKGKTNYMHFCTELTLNLVIDSELLVNLGEEIYVGDYSRTFEFSGESKQLPTLNRDFMPFIDLSQKRVNGFMEEQEYKYDFFINEQEFIVKRDLLRGPVQYNEIDISLMPEKIDMDYINKRYGSDNQLIKKPN